MALRPDEIKQILDALSASDWDEAVVTVDGVQIAVSRGGGLSVSQVAGGLAPAPAGPEQADAPPVPAAVPIDVAHVINAPSVGVFWRSPRPGSPPFVEVGSTVAVGDTVCIVEMMKLMNNVTSDVAGIVTAVHVENSASVEYGTALLSITPAHSDG